MTIHTVGDSHAGDRYSWNGWPLSVVSHHLGSILCYSFGMDPVGRCDIRSIGLQEDDTLIFCMGEIDCRCHVHKYVNSETTYQTIIDGIIDRYFKAIQMSVGSLDVKLKHVCVYNVVPPIVKGTVAENPMFPYLGGDEERRAYTLYFNDKIKEKCVEYGFVFFDVYDKYTDANGFLNHELSDKIVHLKDGQYIKEFLVHKLGLSIS